MNFYLICTKLVTDIGLRTTKTCSKFQLNQNTYLIVIATFCKVCEMKKKI